MEPAHHTPEVFVRSLQGIEVECSLDQHLSEASEGAPLYVRRLPHEGLIRREEVS